MFTFWMILSGDCVHVRSRMKRENCGFCPKSLRFNESCRLKVVGLKLLLLRLTSSNFSSVVKQFFHIMACVGFDCAFRKSRMNDTLWLSGVIDAADVRMAAIWRIKILDNILSPGDFNEEFSSLHWAFIARIFWIFSTWTTQHSIKFYRNTVIILSC